MMKNLLLPILLCVTGFAAAQTSKLVFAHQHSDAAFDATSKKLPGGKYYEILQVPFEAEDAAFFVYRSDDFRVVFGVQNEAGQSKLIHDKKAFVKNVTSSVKTPFRPPSPGNYTFVFTTRDSAAMGKFSVDVYMYRKNNDKVRNEGSTFGNKLNYLIGQRFLGFEFVKLSRAMGFGVENFNPTVMLFDDAKCQISDLDGQTSYDCSFPTFTNLDDANKKLEELEAATSAALPGSFIKKITTVDNYVEKARFVRAVRFTEPGLLPFDRDPLHVIDKVKNRVDIKILKGKKPGEYELTYEIN